MSLKPDRFEQDEPFTTRLRGILTEYPPGTTILKELLQNADDAGAKLIVPFPLPFLGVTV
jgi:sacsin